MVLEAIRDGAAMVTVVDLKAVLNAEVGHAPVQILGIDA